MANDDLSVILPRVLVVSRRTVRKNKFVDFVGEYHLDLIVGYGAVPVIVPRVKGVHMLLDSFEPIHGVLLCEGEDLDPSLYEDETSGLSQEELEDIRRLHASDTSIDKEKDSIELGLAKLCLERNIPYLGICRGSQVLIVACGGTLYQDVEKELSKMTTESTNNYGDERQAVIHMDYDNYDGHRHVVKVLRNTPLHHWFRDSLDEKDMDIWVNSYHHQGVKKLAQRFVPMAFAPDGLIEGFYDPDAYNPEEGKFIMGLQFHPERMRDPDSDEFDYPGCPAAYQEFVKAVIAYQKKLNRSTSAPKSLKLDQEMENKRKVILKSFRIAKNIYTTGCGRHTSKESELEAGAEFLESNTALSLQQENRLKQMGATVRNATSYMERLKLNEQRERVARNVMAKMSVEQLSDLLSIYHMMGQVCSEVLDIKLHGIVNEGLGTIQILADALPKIVPYVLINHREELLPLIMCAIERHPDSSTRDSLTHTLFNLIKRPDEQQRRIIMDACVNLANNVGEMRTETELLPQCWEQISHMYEERRMLVAQSCGELAKYVRPEIRDSLILSITQQLVEDSATVVREAAAHNLALLLPLFPNVDKYFKVEELMFQLICDPAGVVVETTLRELVPAVIMWGNKLDHILRVLLSHILGSAQRCPPLSSIEGSVESHLRVLGERERWNVDVLLRMLGELLPFMHQKAIETCPFPSVSESTGRTLSISMLELYAGGHVEWSSFEWMHIECFPGLIQLACLLPQKEDSLRHRMTKFLLAVSARFGDHYLTHIMLPIFLIAVGDNSDLTYFPSTVHSRIKGLRPKLAISERVANLCILPLLLAGVLGNPGKHENLTEYLRNLLFQGTVIESHSTASYTEIVDAVRFLCTFEEHQNMIFNILWEMVVSSNAELKTNAANLLKVIVPYIDAKVASIHVLPALVTLGSDQNLSVKYASIEAFGSVAQHFKNDMIVDKIRVQMDAFMEDGSHEATIAVVRALVVAVPHTTDRLRDYLLSKIFQLTTTPIPGNDLKRRRERADTFCESIRALDATDLPVTSVKEYLLPAIQNLLKDIESLDPAHKEALEIIAKERSGGTFQAISSVMGMGANLGLPSSVSSFFGEGGLLGKKESAAATSEPVESPKAVQPPVTVEDTRFRRIMRGNFTEMLRAKNKGQEDIPRTQ